MMFRGSKKPVRKFVALQTNVFGGYTVSTHCLRKVTLLLPCSLSEGCSLSEERSFTLLSIEAKHFRGAQKLEYRQQSFCQVHS
jgi:hypothetical protein